MATEAREFSEYHLRDWWPETKIIPDLIPIVGIVIWGERVRRKSGLSFKECFLRGFEKDLLVSMGTRNWPEPINDTARIRSNLMAMRNVGMAFYHGVSLAVLGRLLGAI